jgi:hypothetical protein
MRLCPDAALSSSFSSPCSSVLFQSVEYGPRAVAPADEAPRQAQLLKDGVRDQPVLWLDFKLPESESHLEQVCEFDSFCAPAPALFSGMTAGGSRAGRDCGAARP